MTNLEHLDFVEPNPLEPENYAQVAMTVKAVRLTDANAFVVAIWCGGRAIVEHDPLNPGNFTTTLELTLNVLGSTKIAQVGDYIVKFNDGVFYPVPDLIFERDYRQVRVN